MKKRVYIIHGWDGYPEEGWFPWLNDALASEGFEVHVPQMPWPGKPRIQTWVPALAKLVGEADTHTYFVGHSMGCQAIARYLETLPSTIVVGGVVFVAGFFKELSGLDDDEEVQETDKHWLETPIDLLKVAAHMRKSVAIFSDDDPFVPLGNQGDFRNKLNSQIIVLENQGHFSGSDGITELPIVLEKLLEISKA